jgi:hypothetical protein
MHQNMMMISRTFRERLDILQEALQRILEVHLIHNLAK